MQDLPHILVPPKVSELFVGAAPLVSSLKTVHMLTVNRVPLDGGQNAFLQKSRRLESGFSSYGGFLKRAPALLMDWTPGVHNE